MRLLRLSGFVLLTLGLFLLVLFIFSSFLAAGFVPQGQIGFAAVLLILGEKLFELGISFIVIGGALTYLASRREQFAAGDPCCCLREDGIVEEE